MPTEPTATNKISIDSLLPPHPLPEGALDFSERVHGLMDGRPKDDATVARAMEGMDAIFDTIAKGLYTLASMLVGEGEESVRVVEKAIATAEISVCADPVKARKNSRRALCSTALDALARGEAGSLDAPEGLEPASTCIEDDDLDAAGVSGEELERMIAGPDRERVRKWLAGLPVAVRAIFVMRAVAGFSAAETAGLLAAHGGPGATGWTTDAVRVTFRQGLCSLASQLIQASAKSS